MQTVLFHVSDKDKLVYEYTKYTDMTFNKKYQTSVIAERSIKHYVLTFLVLFICLSYFNKEVVLHIYSSIVF